MTNLTLIFDRPWLMILLVPALAFTLLTYFLAAKKFRKTRNRIISMALHMVVMLLCISVLAGMKFNYEIPNTENEIILLVDVSDTTEKSLEQREEFMKTVISESKYDGYKIGVVTFGFTQVYAVPLTFDTEKVFTDYQNAPLPDTSATDIAAALNFTSGLFEHNETAKIILISDGKETDESATTVIRSISAHGTKIDTVYISSDYGEDNVQVVGVDFPAYHVNVGEECTVGVSVNAKNAAHSTVIELFDNGKSDTETDLQTVDLASGLQTVNFRKTFETEGLHEIRVKITESGDSLEENNVYYSYIYLEVYNRVLVIDQGKEETESDEIVALLTQEDNDYSVDVLHLLSGEGVPTEIDDLLQYDQVVLNNIANSDLTPYALDELLYAYVYEYGGGLFTVGGNDENGEAHAYNRFDLNNTLFQQMLPVQAIDYTPPVGVVVVIDASGSMSGEKLDWAKNGAVTCLDALTDRDYIGVIRLESNYHTELQLTSRTEETTIKEVIEKVEIGGSTQFTPAITRAGQALIAEQRVDRKHIIIITDGMPTDKREDYLPQVERLYRNNGITFSVVGIDFSEGSSYSDVMIELVKSGGGTEKNVYYADSEHDLLSALLKDLNAPEIKEVEEKEFHPIVANELSQVINGVEYGTVKDFNDEGQLIKETADALSAKLGGFYGVRARDRADVILEGEYGIPIYAQWKFGMGTVGSFMCDLSGNWSADLLADDNGRRLIANIVSNLMPTSNIRPNPIRMELEEENYFNRLNIYTELSDGEYIQGSIIEYTEDGEEIVTSLNTKTGDIKDSHLYVTVNLNAENRYTRSTFVVKKSGIYKIVLSKCDSAGNVMEGSTAEMYKSFSYSKEYDTDTEAADINPSEMMAELAVKGNGAAIESDNPWGVFRDFVTGISRTWDPALTFMIIAAVLFLLDIAVRKFKFKWLHEIIRERKERKSSEKV